MKFFKSFSLTVDEPAPPPPVPPPDPPPAPSNLLSISNLSLTGSFRAPFTNGTPDNNSFAYGGTAPALSSNGTLFLVGHANHQRVAEITIPTPGTSATTAGLPVATLVKGFADITNGIKSLPFNGNPATGNNRLIIGGMNQMGSEMVVTLYVYYDANGGAVYSHCVCGMDLNAPSSRGPYALNPSNKSGQVAGVICSVPSSWQGHFGEVIGGLCGVPIVGRQSAGPVAIGYNPSEFGTISLPSRTNLMFYTLTNFYPNSDWDWKVDLKAQNQNWNMASTVRGMAFVERNGKTAVMCIGVRGQGKIWYGESSHDFTNDTSVSAEVKAHFGGPLVDAYENAKGYHAQSYVPTVWFFDPQELLKVKQGLKQEYEMEPYEVSTLSMPYQSTFPGREAVGGAAYDAATGKLYVVQRYVHLYPTTRIPVIHVYQIS